MSIEGEPERVGGESDFHFYRGLFNEEEHSGFVHLLAFPAHMRNLPDAPVRLPLANDSTLPDSQKVRYELKYLTEIFKSWKQVALHIRDQISLQSLLSVSVSESREVEYEHDGLTYKSIYRRGSKLLKDGKFHYYFRIPLANNGYLYRIIKDEDILRRGMSLHDGPAHPGGIGGYVALTKIGSGCLYEFARFAEEWFECHDDEALESLSQSVYYNAQANRVDIVVRRFDFPNPGDRVSLEFCFEPGFPVKTFGPDSFGLSRDYLDGEVGE